ncbi:MAG TPA: ATP-binding protein, partial [Frankiaceae bacterium]|nr:ATP-binding protein [Frankiaceae bacterium]
MIRRWKIRTKLAVLAAIPVLALLVVAVFGTSTFTKVRVGGPSYGRIFVAKDVVADVLPPPEYVVESYLTVLQLAVPESATERDELLARLAGLEREYRVRHDYWQRNLTSPAIRKSLLQDSYLPADAFWRAVDNEFLPRVRAGDLPSAQRIANTRLRGLYGQHRAAIDNVVQQATAEQKAVEASTRRLVTDQSRLLVLIFALLVLAAVAVGVTVVRSIVRSIVRLRRIAAEDLPQAIDKVLHAGPDEEVAKVDPVVLDSQDELAEAVNSVVGAAVDLAVEQARLRRNTADTFVSLGRRNQNLVARQLRFIDQTEKSETNPALLSSLFRLDYLATRMRRNAESLLVLAGVEPPRKWKQAVPLVDVVRGSFGEVEGYERVQLGVMERAVIPGKAIADVSHLLAELIENALRFSPPDSPVTVAGVMADDGYVLAIRDQGMGMAPRDLAAANARLRESGRFAEAPTAYLGMFVVARLAARYGIEVDLDSEGGDGLTAFVRFPAAMVRAQGADTPSAERDRWRHEAFVRAAAGAADDRSGPPPVASPAAGAAAPPPPVPVADPAPDLSDAPPWPRPGAAPGAAAPPAYTRAGLRRRQSTVEGGRPDGAAIPPVPPPGERRPEEVRSRYGSFNAGKHRAQRRDERAVAAQRAVGAPDVPASPATVDDAVGDGAQARRGDAPPAAPPEQDLWAPRYEVDPPVPPGPPAADPRTGPADPLAGPIDRTSAGFP